MNFSLVLAPVPDHNGLLGWDQLPGLVPKKLNLPGQAYFPSSAGDSFYWPLSQHELDSQKLLTRSLLIFDNDYCSEFSRPKGFLL